MGNSKLPAVLKTSVALMSVMVAAGCASHQSVSSSPTSVPVSPSVATSTFDSLWTLVHDTYVDTVFVRTRWTAVRDTLRPRAASVTTRAELNSLLAETLQRIPDSHFYVIPEAVELPDNSSDQGEVGGSTGISLRAAAASGVVWRVDPGSPGALAGIKPGQIIEKVGDRDVGAALRKVGDLPVAGRPRALAEVLFSLNHALSPGAGSAVRIRLRDADGRLVDRQVVAVPATGTVSQFGNLPPLAGRVVVQLLETPGSPGASCVGVIGFNIWLPALVPELERAMDKVSDCKGIVVDLRGNPGGVGAMVMGFGGYFVDSALSLGTMRSRELSLHFAMNPRRVKSDGSPVSPYAGLMAILVDPMTASTSEIFATGMQRIGRARVFGERSAGEALPALTDRLPSGDVFVHAVADFVDPGGRRIEGAGVVPDEVVPISPKDLSEGKDAALDAATRWIRSTAAKHTPAT
ncbi:MAG: S41 family peptidase [Thermoanaerobaculia bacterium]